MTYTDELDEYILSHIGKEDEYLYYLYRQTYLKLVRPHMVSGHLQGKLLRMLVQMIRPRRILEIGTYTGYATLCMASGLEEGGKVVTYEINDELEDFTRSQIEGSPWGKRVEMRIGDALEDLPRREEDCFDMAFVDGNKRQYVEYYHLMLQYVKPGGYVLADNTLWDGHVTDAAYDHDSQTLGIRAFNDLVAADERVEKVILPLRDGLTLIRIKSNL